MIRWIENQLYIDRYECDECEDSVKVASDDGWDCLICGGRMELKEPTDDSMEDSASELD